MSTFFFASIFTQDVFCSETFSTACLKAFLSSATSVSTKAAVNAGGLHSEADNGQFREDRMS